MNIEQFFGAYVEAALWSSTDDDGTPLDRDFTAADIDAATLASMRWPGAERAGHDFWLTRNRHGAGFWDRGLGALGDRLTDAAHAFGEVYLYVNDDGEVTA